MINITEKKEYEIPWIINLELTNACNLKCVFCDHPTLRKKMVIKNMDDRLLNKILLDIKSYVKKEKIYELGVVGLGEPTLDRNLERHLQFIGEMQDIFERITFNSNAVSLGKKQSEILLDSSIDAYTFSVNASNKKTYMQMMGIDKFDVVANNLRTFFRFMERKDRRPRVDVQIFESEKSSLDELKGLFPEAKDLNINFFCRKIYSKPVIQKDTELLNVHKPEQEDRYPCWDIYTRIYIDVHGNLYPCTIGNDCYREDSNLCLGNIHNNSLFDLFNSQKIQAARRRAEKGELSFPECEICNIWFLTPNNFNWNEAEQIWQKKKKRIRAYNLKG